MPAIGPDFLLLMAIKIWEVKLLKTGFPQARRDPRGAGGGSALVPSLLAIPVLAGLMASCEGFGCPLVTKSGTSLANIPTQCLGVQGRRRWGGGPYSLTLRQELL